MSFLLNPFVFAGAAGDFESIATVTVGSGGAADIEFTSIPGTYQHLQLRIISKSTSTEDNGDMIFNGVTTNSYAWHSLYGDGSSAAADASSSRANIVALRLAGSTATSVFSANVIDILDYADTSKNTTVRIFKGQDNNGSGVVFVESGLYAATTSVTSIKFSARSHNFAEHSTAALYGIKA